MIFKLNVDNSLSGANFNYYERVINIGKYKDKKEYVQVLSHEISEIIHILLNNRFYNSGNDSYMFIMNHSDFQTHNEILLYTLYNNKIIK